MNKTFRTTLTISTLTAGLLAASAASAHVSYTNRNLGTFTGTTIATNTISNQAIAGNWGWADAADADWGDSHKVRWFRFTLNNAADVTLTASANATATAASIGELIPGFSLYGGLAPAAAYDNATVTQAYRAALPFATEGALNTLGDFQIGNDSAAINTLSFIGHSLDGGGFLGDGNLNGTTSRTFSLAAGTYSLVVGGGDYFAQLPSNPDFSKPYGMSVSIAVTPVPEPSAIAMVLAGLACAGVAIRRRAAR
jgi:hypothetical protein